jgi:hypothetical protein
MRAAAGTGIRAAASHDRRAAAAGSSLRHAACATTRPCRQSQTGSRSAGRSRARCCTRWRRTGAVSVIANPIAAGLAQRERPVFHRVHRQWQRPPREVGDCPDLANDVRVDAVRPVIAVVRLASPSPSCWASMWHACCATLSRYAEVLSVTRGGGPITGAHQCDEVRGDRKRAWPNRSAGQPGCWGPAQESGPAPWAKALDRFRHRVEVAGHVAGWRDERRRSRSRTPDSRLTCARWRGILPGAAVPHAGVNACRQDGWLSGGGSDGPRYAASSSVGG